MKGCILLELVDLLYDFTEEKFGDFLISQPTEKELSMSLQEFSKGTINALDLLTYIDSKQLLPREFWKIFFLLFEYVPIKDDLTDNSVNLLLFTLSDYVDKELIPYDIAKPYLENSKSNLCQRGMLLCCVKGSLDPIDRLFDLYYKDFIDENDVIFDPLITNTQQAYLLTSEFALKIDYLHKLISNKGITDYKITLNTIYNSGEDNDLLKIGNPYYDTMEHLLLTYPKLEINLNYIGKDKETNLNFNYYQLLKTVSDIKELI